MFPFDRIARAVDEWAEETGYTDVVVQIGEGKYEPRHVEWRRMMGPDEFRDAIQRCDLVVAHLGMGSIITAMQAEKPIVLLPRIRALGEHTSDHQLDGVAWLRDRPGLWIADDVAGLRTLLGEYLSGRLTRGLTPVSPYASEELLGHVRAFVFER